MPTHSDLLVEQRPVDEALLATYPDALPPLLARLYAAREVPADALEPALAGLIPVRELEGVTEAAERLEQALRAKERILVVGDFDADGATGTALLVSCLRGFGFDDVAYLVPSRFEFGYGLTEGLVGVARESSPNLIITVDNGVASIDGVATANASGIDVLITDHHLPGPQLPEAAVVVNPNLADSQFPSKALAGVGVAFYVMAALGRRLADAGLIPTADAGRIPADCLDLVALGTVADVVPLDTNNRILVAEGLRRIRGGRARPGIAALFAVAGRDVRDAAPVDFGFGLGPRLNAAGRLEDMALGIDCLLAGSFAEAEAKARQLDELNQERRRLQEQMHTEALEHLERAQLPEAGDGQVPVSYTLFDPGWHQGIVGLVATRIKEQVQRPVMAFAPADDGDGYKGSARSVPGLHIRDLIAQVDAGHPGLITKFGGHAMAAGLTVAADGLELFAELFAEAAEEHREHLEAVGRLPVDGPLAASELGLEIAELLRTAGPWGQGFPEPVFRNRFEVLDQRLLNGGHLKLKLAFDGTSVDAIWFGQDSLLAAEVCPDVDLVYRLDLNVFRGRRSAQLVVEHRVCD